MKTKLVILLLVVIVLAGCSKRLTRQFVPSEGFVEGKYLGVEVSGWTIEQPRLVAYKDMIDLSKIENPNMFWLTLQASYHIKNKESVTGDFNLDSVGIVTPVLDTLWLSVEEGIDFIVTENESQEPVARKVSQPDSTRLIFPMMDTTMGANGFEVIIPVKDTTWRKPSRVSEFDDNMGKYHQKVFNFFNDQGIEIPAMINNSTLIFTVKIMNDDKVVSKENIEFDLIRQERSLKVPLLQQ